MEVLDELEAMFATASYMLRCGDQREDDKAVQRWQHLFGYSNTEARRRLEEQRHDLTALVPAASWETVQEHQEALGHDRESYSHWIQLPCSTVTPVGSNTSKRDRRREYLFKLDGPLAFPDQIRDIAGLLVLPKIYEGASESESLTTRFCRVDTATKKLLLSWIAENHPSFPPLFIMQSLARKDFSSLSMAPVLGCDTTLPHNRLTMSDCIPRPSQEEYPVWYFFYGTLADPQTLQRILQPLDGDSPVAVDHELRPARIAGAQLTTYGGKYKALIDGVENSQVDGWAFLVETEQHEEALRSHETGAYEVVRCRITCARPHEEVLYGCTFALAIR